MCSWPDAALAAAICAWTVSGVDCAFTAAPVMRPAAISKLAAKGLMTDLLPQPEFPNSNSDSLIVRFTGPRNKALAWDRALRLALSVR